MLLEARLELLATRGDTPLALELDALDLTLGPGVDALDVVLGKLAQLLDLFGFALADAVDMRLPALLGQLGVARLLGGDRRLHHSREIAQELGPVVYLGEFGAVRRIDSIAAIRAERTGCVPGAFASLVGLLLVGHLALPRFPAWYANPVSPSHAVGVADGTTREASGQWGVVQPCCKDAPNRGGSARRDGAPGRIRTCDLPLRRRLLCPLSYGDGPCGMMRLRAPRVQGSAVDHLCVRRDVSAPAAPRRPIGRPTPWPVPRSPRGSPRR